MFLNVHSRIVMFSLLILELPKTRTLLVFSANALLEEASEQLLVNSYLYAEQHPPCDFCYSNIAL